MKNPNSYAIVRSPVKENALGSTVSRLLIRKRGESNWTLPVPEESFDSEDKSWENGLATALKRSGESVEFSAKDLERLRGEANRILHPTPKTRDWQA